MSCSTPVKTFQCGERVVVYSDGGAAPGASLMFPMSPDRLGEIAAAVDSVRMTILIENAQPNFQGQCAYQTSDDGVNWGPATTVGTAQSVPGGADQHYFTTDWVTVSNALRAIRFGVVASASSGTNPVFGRVSLVVDVRLKS